MTLRWNTPGMMEVGRLTNSFKRLADHVNQNINGRKRVYVDALTSVKNKGAFSDALDDLQTGLNNHNDTPFAISIFGFDNLEIIMIPSTDMK